MSKEKILTGYPSIDKPWLKYYSEEAINALLPEKTLYRYVYDNNKDFLRSTALNYFSKKISYGTLFENIEKAAKALSAIGIKKGDIVTIMSMHTPETIYCIYALNRLGAVANMVYMTLSEQEIVSTIKTTESKVLVVLSVVLEKINKVYDDLDLEHVIVVTPSDSMKLAMRLGYKLKAKPGKLSEKYMSYRSFIDMGNGSIDVQDAPYDKMAPAVIVYTSGSTGEPKGVVLSNYNLNAVAHQYKVSGIQFERGETFFNMLPPYLGFGVSVGLNLALALGLEEILWIMPEPIKVAEAYIRNKPNHFASAPIVIEEIVKRLDNNLKYIKTFSVGGESPKAESVRELNEIFVHGGTEARYITGYGLTETSATVCTQTNTIYKMGTLGVPMVCTNVKIIDGETGEELKYGEIGEMCFSAPNIMQMYYKNADATNEIIMKDDKGQVWLRSGDLGMVDEDGFVYHKGRIKRIYMTMIESGEVYKLFPALVEEKFLKQTSIKSCGTIAIPDEEKLNILVSFVTLNDKRADKEKVAAELMDYAKSELPEHSVPVKIVVLEELPLTQSGKIDYRALEQMTE